MMSLILSKKLDTEVTTFFTVSTKPTTLVFASDTF